MKDFFEKSKNSTDIKTVRLTFDPRYKDLLNSNGFAGLSDFIFAPTENSFRDVPERLTVGLDLIQGSQKTRVYLKRHWTDAKSQSSKPHNEALSEWDNIYNLEKAGLPVPHAMAVGYGFIDSHSVGFVMMKEVPGTQADHFIRDNYEGLSLADKRSLNLQMAELASKFHSLGYNHRDFYLCHTFISHQADQFILNLIDLQRVQKRRVFRQRWIVKDLAQLAYSSLDLVSRSDRLRFYLKYSGNATLSAADKRFIGLLQKKVSRMVKREKEGKVR